MEALLVAVKATNDFEQEMAKRFGGGGSGDSVADEVRLVFCAYCRFPPSAQSLNL